MVSGLDRTNALADRRRPSADSQGRYSRYGWLAGIIYFALNEWWLWTATISGTIGVVVCSGCYWGLAGALIYYLRLSPRAD